MSGRSARNLVRVYQYGERETSKDVDYQYHPCVAPKTFGRGRQIFAVSTSQQLTLLQYINNMKKLGKTREYGFDKPLFIQLAHAVKHIHDAERIINEKLDEDIGKRFKFSEDGKHIILHDFTSVSPSVTARGKSVNIESLGNLFCFVLCDRNISSGNLELEQLVNSNEKATARDLIVKMRTMSNFTINNVLKHPYFWSSMKKIQFLCSVWLLYCSNPHMRSIKNGDTISTQFSDWKKQLVVKVPNDESRKIKPDAVEALIKEPHYNDYAGFELLHFIRNCAAHYWSNEDPAEKHGNKGKQKQDNARRIFQSEHEGFYRFFLREVPCLVHICV